MHLTIFNTLPGAVVVAVVDSSVVDPSSLSVLRVRSRMSLAFMLIL